MPRVLISLREMPDILPKVLVSLRETPDVSPWVLISLREMPDILRSKMSTLETPTAEPLLRSDTKAKGKKKD